MANFWDLLKGNGRSILDNRAAPMHPQGRKLFGDEPESDDDADNGYQNTEKDCEQ